MSTPLYESIAAQLRERMQAGTLVDGARVPSVRLMSRQAGVSGGTQGASIMVNFTEALAVVPTVHVGFEFR